MDRRDAEAFIESYRATFEAMDPAAITDCFTFPCQVIGQAAEVSVLVVPDAAGWLAAIERIVGAYRVLGVSAAGVDALEVLEVTPGVAHAVVRWGLRDGSGAGVYGFTASYTLVETAAGPRIAAIAHDEGPQLANALAART